MPDSEKMAALFGEVARAYGPGFSCYTERDGGPWYIVAGYRESWHGAGRVADTDTLDRDQARAFALHLMGRDVPGFAFTETRRSGEGGARFIEYAGSKGDSFTVWTEAAERAFPAWHERAGLAPAYYVRRGPDGLELRRERYRVRFEAGTPHASDLAATAPDRAALAAIIGDKIRERIDWSAAV